MPAHNRPNIRVSSPRTAKSRSRKTRVRQSWNTLLRRVSRGARLGRRTLTAAPRAVRIVCLAALVLAAFSLTNLVYHVVCKPSELLFFVGGALDKQPIETWRRYKPLFPHLFHQHDHARAAGRVGAGRKHRQSGGAHLLALAAHLESLRCVQARLERRGHVPDDRCSLRRGGTLLYPRERCRGYRLRVHRPPYPRGPEPCHRARGRVPGPPCRGGSCPRARRSGKPAAEAGSRRIHPSLRRRSRLGLRAPRFSDDGRRALRRSPRRGISRQGQCDEAAVSAPCCQQPELASNGCVTAPAHSIRLTRPG